MSHLKIEPILAEDLSAWMSPADIFSYHWQRNTCSKGFINPTINLTHVRLSLQALKVLCFENKAFVSGVRVCMWWAILWFSYHPLVSQCLQLWYPSDVEKSVNGNTILKIVGEKIETEAGFEVDWL